MRTAVSDIGLRKRGIYGFMHVIILLLSLFLVISISIDTFRNIQFYTQTSYLKIQLWICLFFLFDFFLEFFLAKDKLRYLRTHFIFFLVAIPYQNIISYFHLQFSDEVMYFIRFIPLVRGGYALAIVVGWLSYNKASGLFISYVTMLLATVYFSSLIFYVLEHTVNPGVKNYGDALWWAFMDVTTVGSNIIAVTPTGRVLSVVLAALGMMMFPIFTVYVTSLVQESNKRKEEYYEQLSREAASQLKEARRQARANANAAQAAASGSAAASSGTDANATADAAAGTNATAGIKATAGTNPTTGTDAAAGTHTTAGTNATADTDTTSGTNPTPRPTT